jgi:hypothetical protein
VKLLSGLARHEAEGAARPREVHSLGEHVGEAQSRVRSYRLVEAPRRRDVGDADPDMVDAARLTHPAVMHRLCAVAVRVEKECSVVVLAVLRTRARGAVVPIAGFGTRAPELVDLRSRRCEEGDVQPACDRLVLAGLREREVAPLRVWIRTARLLQANRRQNRVVEPLGGRTIRDPDRHVVEHVS